VSPRLLVSVFVLLTASTGVVDAVSFLSLGHVFTANMTGNVVFIAFACAGVPGLSAARSGTALVAFLAGAASGVRAARNLRVNAVSPKLAAMLLGEGLALSLATAIAVRFESQLAEGRMQLYVVIALTAWAMGLQSATALRLAAPGLVPNVLTTALTWIATDPRHDSAWTRRAASVSAMFAGALVGAWLWHFSKVWPLALSGVITTAAALAIVSVTRTESSPSSPCLRDSTDGSGTQTSRE
jgi:uncharacterized membrane protein YoaK (UPF0700 family)